jgi:ribonuclease H / adenosylcobalamin/alpha-ribazole phosphatase
MLGPQLQGWWRIKEPRLKLLAKKVRAGLLQLPGTYTFEHIPREENAYADRLANDTLDKW